ncbi:hypothetical protein COCNU_13G001110 [Cocos nucifera]|uniref:Uncharacterized protein n=1 Tax=Cocos nucifera TaxID=13894 RepID=A0A8K0IS93_COCNU|nr:hypothetical protein COCNU_13G001110 [Cocos nucifera]
MMTGDSQAQLVVEVALPRVEMAVVGSDYCKGSHRACHKCTSSPILDLEETPQHHLGSNLKLPQQSKLSTAAVSGVDAPYLQCRYYNSKLKFPCQERLGYDQPPSCSSSLPLLASKARIFVMQFGAWTSQEKDKVT